MADRVTHRLPAPSPVSWVPRSVLEPAPRPSALELSRSVARDAEPPFPMAFSCARMYEEFSVQDASRPNPRQSVSPSDHEPLSENRRRDPRFGVDLDVSLESD